MPGFMRQVTGIKVVNSPFGRVDIDAVDREAARLGDSLTHAFVFRTMNDNGAGQIMGCDSSNLCEIVKAVSGGFTAPVVIPEMNNARGAFLTGNNMATVDALPETSPAMDSSQFWMISGVFSDKAAIGSNFIPLFQIIDESNATKTSISFVNSNIQFKPDSAASGLGVFGAHSGIPENLPVVLGFYFNNVTKQSSIFMNDLETPLYTQSLTGHNPVYAKSDRIRLFQFYTGIGNLNLYTPNAFRIDGEVLDDPLLLEHVTDLWNAAKKSYGIA